jgi:hypothetical protein
LSTSSTSVVAAAGPTASTPKGPTVDISSFSGGRCRTCRQHPQGARCRRLQHRWWPLPKILTATPRGLPSMSPASVVVVAGPADSTSPGGPPSTSPASVVAATKNPDSTPQGAHRRCLPNLGTCRQNFFCDTYQGVAVVNITTISKATSRKSEG